MADLNEKDASGSNKLIGADPNTGAETFFANVKSNGSLFVDASIATVNGTVDANNSTTTPLADGTSFVGTATDITNYALITVFTHAEPSSAVGTLFFEFSTDGTNWDRTIQIPVIDPETHPPHTLIPVAQFFRLRFVDTSDTFGQSALRLQTILHPTKSKALTSRLSDQVTGTTDVDNVRAIIAGLDQTTGIYDQVLTDGGQLLVKAEGVSSNTTLQGKRFISTSGIQTLSPASEGEAALIRNPIGSGKNLILDRQLFVSIDQGVNMIFRMYETPTVTLLGAAEAINNALIGDATATVAEIYDNTTTVSSFGILINTYQARDQIEFDELQGRVVLPPGQDLLLTIEASGNNKRWSHTVAWIEEDV